MGLRLGLLGAVILALALSASAGAQLPELPGVPTVPDLPEVPEVPETPVPNLPGTSPVPSPPPPPPAAPATSGDTGASGSSSASSGSGSTSSRSRQSSSRDAGPRTRFDRLPRRFEVLLERILRGRNVAENLRRLEQALGSASPELRARIERLVRREIAALERGRMTPEERRRRDRLQRVLRLLEQGAGSTGAATPVAAGASTPSGTAASPPGEAPVGDAANAPAGVAAADSGSSPKDEGAGVGSGDSGGGPPGLPDDLTIGTVLLGLLLALLVLAALAFALAAAPSRVLPRGRIRRVVRTSRSGFAFTGLVALGAMMVMLLIGALV